MWVAAWFVVFAVFSSVVGVWRGVSRGSSFGNWVGDTHVDVVGGCFVVAHYVELCLFVVWCAYVAIEFGDVDF